ncbi:DUF2807 domain-containing protein [Cryomorphaceae bacterium]|nr:DUF2807 domain-containing protein [Cryomorphaceae bacterium]
MKRFILFTLSICAYGAMFTSCEDAFCVQGSGDVEIRDIFVEDFSGIENRTVIDIYLTQSSDPSGIVEARGQSNVLDQLDITVIQGVLVIDNRECFYTDEQLVLYIDVDQLEEIHLYGSGDVFGVGVFEVDDIELDLNGSGDVDLELLADDIETEIRGSGDIRLQGEADSHDLRISGSGDVEAFGLWTEESDVRISGSGSAEVYAEDVLDVVITGSGSVYYKGYPDLNVTITGSGSLINDN